MLHTDFYVSFITALTNDIPERGKQTPSALLPPSSPLPFSSPLPALPRQVLEQNAGIKAVLLTRGKQEGSG